MSEPRDEKKSRKALILFEDIDIVFDEQGNQLKAEYYFDRHVTLKITSIKNWAPISTVN